MHAGSTWKVAAAALGALWILAVGTSTGAAQGPEKSVNDGVYSADQAERGQKAFDAKCGVCHETERFKGDAFIESWTGEPLFALFDTIVTIMPADNPGGLPPQQYADIVAYLLKLNGYPAGQEELAAGKDPMTAIRIETLKAASPDRP